MEQEIGVTRDGALYNRKYDSYRVSYSVSKHINENARFVLFLLGVVKSFLGTVRAKPMAELFNDNEEFEEKILTLLIQRVITA